MESAVQCVREEKYESFQYYGNFESGEGEESDLCNCWIDEDFSVLNRIF